MKYKVILFLVIMFNTLYAGGCYCASGFSCREVIPQLNAAKNAIDLDYKMTDKIIAIETEKIKKNEDTIAEKQKLILKLTTQIKKIQIQSALEDMKRNFLLKKIKNIKTY